MNTCKCWICGSTSVVRVKDGIAKRITPDDFSITDDRYGITLPIYECTDCGFEFCPEEVDLASMYESMEDESYLETSKSRSIQARKLASFCSEVIEEGSKVLDIGCGSGLLVKEFAELGYDSFGLEPSSFLANKGIADDLKIYNARLEDKDFDNEFNFISLIDVIEHVQNPSELLNNVNKALADGGYLLIVTPRRDSFFRFILGFKWWHYRIAHVGYFSKKNLFDIVENTGFDVYKFRFATWFLPLDYILNRILKYIPPIRYRFSFRIEMSVPINLFDSSMILVRKRAP